jgi:membrane peptidoglycan carboxypeptidase
VGTGKQAKPKGYSAGGKTGTAQKVDPTTGTYSLHNFIASFVGFTPVESPQFAIIVVLDSPRGEYHGGTVAAPVFRRIAEQVLAYRNVPATDPDPLPLKLASYQAAAAAAATASEPVDLEESATQFLEGSPGLVVPSFVGLGVRAVTGQALASRLPIEMEGNGIAYEQEPEAGAWLPQGAKITIRFRIGGSARPVIRQPQAPQPLTRPSAVPAATAAALPASG